MLELSEREDEDMKAILCIEVNFVNNRPERSVWRYPTSNDWWMNIYPNLPEHLFIQHFRVDRPTFQWIVEQVSMDMTTKDTKFRNAVPIEKKVAASLKCLATTCDFLTIAALFGIGKSSVQKYFLQFVNSVYKRITPNAIKFPSEEQIRTAAMEFEMLWGFPMAFAAIDGTHVPFNPPQNLASDFYNYKGWSSVMAIAMCDARGKAVWIKCGVPGRSSDSGAFKSTKCYDRISRGELIPSGSRVIEGENVPFLILGDSGFAMERWLIKPFTHHGTMTNNQRMFNYRHSRARRAVESMFGRVKCRWRRLLRGLDVKYKNAHIVITAAFALHNVCESRALDFVPTQEEVMENAEWEGRYPQPTTQNGGESYSGVTLRNALMNYFGHQNNPWTGEH